MASLAQEMLVYSEQGKPAHISISGGSAPKVLFKRLSQAPYAKTVQWKTYTSVGGMNDALVASVNA